MSRGTMFHVVTDPECLGTMGEEDFYEHVGVLGVDYVMDDPREQAAMATNRLKKMIAEAGFGLAEVEGEYGDEAAFAFRADTRDELDAARQNWFRKDLAALKRKVAGLDLKSFACGIGPACDLRRLIGDPYGDAVFLDQGTGPAIYDMASFVRRMQCGYTYYVDRATVYMH